MVRMQIKLSLYATNVDNKKRINVLWTQIFPAHIGRFCYLVYSLFSFRDWSACLCFRALAGRGIPLRLWPFMNFEWFSLVLKLEYDRYNCCDQWNCLRLLCWVNTIFLLNDHLLVRALWKRYLDVQYNIKKSWYEVAPKIKWHTLNRSNGEAPPIPSRSQ